MDFTNLVNNKSLIMNIIFSLTFSGSDDDDVVIAAFKSFDEDGKIDSEK
jgi:hypothetical protein